MSDPNKVNGLPVAGYNAQPPHKIEAVNVHKDTEERLLRRIESLPDIVPDLDHRWAAVARTHFEQGFMALNRAVFKPGRVVLPGDDVAQGAVDG
ncbi:MAG: hypothetical protein J0I48_19170 [Devosia sp.]|uniref:Acb2/Tad1 domain-containing protein n=1 Tax=Devosia sp. 66-22 TaxID=1895753 RepID=UPI0009269252|nr:hypothetical protein [Devosia sp. 66-22]MBN9348288.1 hypothetical protein [Devosia sp.]OJX48971.1 MAG: hypothetical protein BGO81_10275 [Devosia sp. 66-22]